MAPNTTSNMEAVQKSAEVVESGESPISMEQELRQTETKQKTRRGKRPTTAQKNALRREARSLRQGSDHKLDCVETDADVKSTTTPAVPTTGEIGGNTLSSTEAATTFHGFSKLPAELRLKIIKFAAKELRYIGLQLHYEHPDIHWTYLPFSKNYCSILQANQEIREEGLKHFQSVVGRTNRLGRQFDVYINYESDLVVLPTKNIADDMVFREFPRLNGMVPVIEKVQRIVVPLPNRDYHPPYMEIIRQQLPNLKELCFFPDGNANPSVKTHKCKYPSVTGNPTVLVDISDYWPTGEPMRYKAPEFEVLRRKFAQEKEKFPEWKLERIRLVIWAKKNRGEGYLNVGRVADIHGDGIYQRVGEKCPKHQ